MRVFSRLVPTISTSIPDIIGAGIEQSSSVALQAPAANISTIFFGGKNEQPFELRPEANALLPINQIKDVFILGSSGDRISIVIF